MPLDFNKAYRTSVSGFDGYITFWQHGGHKPDEQIVVLTKDQFLQIMENAKFLLDEADRENEE